MNQSNPPRSGETPLWFILLKRAVLYALVPLLLLGFLAQPISEAVRQSPAAAFWILLAFLGAVGLNWAVYAAGKRKPPSLPVFAYGAFCLFIVTMIQYMALPGYSPVASSLSYIAAVLTLTALLLVSFWCASRASKAAHVTAVGIWIVLGFTVVGAAYQIIRDLESGDVTRDTWITLGILLALLVGFNVPGILSACRRFAARRRRTGQVMGRIVQIIGETHLDRDDDLVTRNHVRVQYTVQDVSYETRADISRYTIWRYGKKALVGCEVPVFYDPANPADAFANKVDKHVLVKEDP